MMARKGIVALLVALVAIGAALPAFAQAKPVTVTFWYGAAASEAGQPPADWKAYQILRDKLGVDLQLVQLPSTSSDQDTKINTTAAANNLPDLFQVNRDTWYKLAKAGLLAPVDSLLKAMPVRTKDRYSDAVRNKLVTINGKMYGFAEPGALPGTDGFVIRKDWLDKLGLKVPVTIEDFFNVAKAFTEQDPDGNGKNDTYGFCGYIEPLSMAQQGLGSRFDAILGAFGADSTWDITSAKNFGLKVRQPGYYEAMLFLKKMADAKVIDPDWATLKKDDFRARWKQGRYGMMTEGYAALAMQANYKDFDTNFPDGEWIAVAPPKGPKGLSSEGPFMRGTRIIAVSAKAIKEGRGPAIARMLEWMATNEGYYLLGFGEKGVNYDIDASGLVTVAGIDPAKAYTAKPQAPLLQLKNYVYRNDPAELKVRYVTFKTVKGRTMDPLAYWEAFKKNTWSESTGALVINPPANAADFWRFYTENQVKFVLGLQPLTPETWKQYLDGLDRLGARDFEKAAKAQVMEAGFIK
jgi:putative aldouronate transport system substrate-binding protein